MFEHYLLITLDCSALLINLTSNMNWHKSLTIRVCFTNERVWCPIGARQVRLHGDRVPLVLHHLVRSSLDYSLAQYNGLAGWWRRGRPVSDIRHRNVIPARTTDVPWQPTRWRRGVWCGKARGEPRGHIRVVGIVPGQVRFYESIYTTRTCTARYELEQASTLQDWMINKTIFIHQNELAEKN